MLDSPQHIGRELPAARGLPARLIFGRRVPDYRVAAGRGIRIGIADWRSAAPAWRKLIARAVVFLTVINWRHRVVRADYGVGRLSLAILVRPVEDGVKDAASENQ